ncbi:uncharacterized protein LOC135819707 isoform X2 [Sycon ciliatum]|uniref:uncharacterized protein LOC135819707 isoform X2 n=1 Tax=Sycon ciliatum TaxID=27933 RepID=UPI0031F72091
MDKIPWTASQGLGSPPPLLFAEQRQQNNDKDYDDDIQETRATKHTPQAGKLHPSPSREITLDTPPLDVFSGMKATKHTPQPGKLHPSPSRETTLDTPPLDNVSRIKATKHTPQAGKLHPSPSREITLDTPPLDVFSGMKVHRRPVSPTSSQYPFVKNEPAARPWRSPSMGPVPRKRPASPPSSGLPDSKKLTISPPRLSGQRKRKKPATGSESSTARITKQIAIEGEASDVQLFMSRMKRWAWRSNVELRNVQVERPDPDQAGKEVVQSQESNQECVQSQECSSDACRPSFASIALSQGTDEDEPSKPSDVKPSDVKPSDVNPSDVKPSDVKPSDVKPSDVDQPDDTPPDVTIDALLDFRYVSENNTNAIPIGRMGTILILDGAMVKFPPGAVNEETTISPPQHLVFEERLRIAKGAHVTLHCLMGLQPHGKHFREPVEVEIDVPGLTMEEPFVHIVHYPCTSDGSLTGLDDTTDYSRPSACTPCSVVQIGRNRCSMIRYPAGDEHVTTSPCSMFPQSEKTRKCSLQDGWPFRKVEVDISRKVVRYTKCHFSYEVIYTCGEELSPEQISMLPCTDKLKACRVWVYGDKTEDRDPAHLHIKAIPAVGPFPAPPPKLESPPDGMFQLARSRNYFLLNEGDSISYKFTVHPERDWQPACVENPPTFYRLESSARFESREGTRWGGSVGPLGDIECRSCADQEKMENAHDGKQNGAGAESATDNKLKVVKCRTIPITFTYRRSLPGGDISAGPDPWTHVDFRRLHSKLVKSMEPELARLYCLQEGLVSWDFSRMLQTNEMGKGRICHNVRLLEHVAIGGRKNYEAFFAVLEELGPNFLSLKTEFEDHLRSIKGEEEVTAALN